MRSAQRWVRHTCRLHHRPSWSSQAAIVEVATAPQSCGLQLARADERGLGLCSVGWGAGLRTGRMDQIVLQAGGLVCRDLWRWEDGYS